MSQMQMKAPSDFGIHLHLSSTAHFLSSDTQWAPYHLNLNYRGLTTAPVERLHIFLRPIILTEA